MGSPKLVNQWFEILMSFDELDEGDINRCTLWIGMILIDDKCDKEW